MTDKPSTSFRHDGLTVAYLQKGLTVAHVSQALGNSTPTQVQQGGSTPAASTPAAGNAPASATAQKP